MFDIIDFIKKSESREEAYDYINKFDSTIDCEKLRDEVPDNLYRYTNLNEFVLDNLEKKEVTLTSPILFNDSFDTLLPYEYISDDDPETDEAIENFIPGYKEKRMEVKNSEMGRRVQKAYEEFATTIFRVACFTTSEVLDTFWGNYAEKSTGICIKYKNLKKDYFYPIVYSGKMVDTSQISDPTRDQNKFHLALLLSTIIKKNTWSGEDEWRCVLGYPEWSGERIDAYVASVECIYLGVNFISYWKEKQQSSNEEYENILLPFMSVVEQQDIPLKMMEKESPFSYELKSKIIEVGDVLSLIENEG